MNMTNGHGECIPELNPLTQISPHEYEAAKAFPIPPHDIVAGGVLRVFHKVENNMWTGDGFINDIFVKNKDLGIYIVRLTAAASIGQLFTSEKEKDAHGFTRFSENGVTIERFFSSVAAGSHSPDHFSKELGLLLDNHLTLV